jgi:hypothetical protein
MRDVLRVPGQEFWEELFELFSKWKGELSKLMNLTAPEDVTPGWSPRP